MNAHRTPSESPAVAARGESLSIVVPFFNEEESVQWVLEEVRALYPEAEIIAVDDGSTDETWARLRRVPGIRRLRLRENRGQSAAVWVGLQRATRPICALMDGDGQNDPEDLGALVAALQNADVACGYRRHRKDTLSKRLASRLANSVRRGVLGDGVRDTGCSLKAFGREHVGCLIPFNGLHRFLPATFKSAGLRLVEVEVNHRPRRFGTTKYGNLSRGVRGLYDLIGVRWLSKRALHLPAIEQEDE